MPGSEVNELGRVLQEARTRKGATLADAQQATKIRQSFLQALENEDYSVLPPPFYIRGFIKNYAVYLGLDPRATVQIFDEALENEALARAAGQADVVHSADSGGRTGMFPLAGLSQGEARLVEASSEKLNLAALPAPALPGDSYENADSADSGGYVSGGPLARRNYNGLYAPEKYVLKPVMLPETKGAFYMPNFIPVVLVVIIIAAACLLVYRGISSNQNVTSEAAVATATAQASVTLDSSLTLTPGATTTAGSSFTAPPFFTPDSSMAAPTPEIAGGVVSPKNGKPAQVAPAATPTPPPPPTATPLPPTPTPLPDPITVDISIGTDDPKGSWVTIWVDDQQKVAKMAAPGETFNFQGRKVAIRAGRPNNVSVKVNGQDKVYVQPNAGIITHTYYADGHDTVEQ